MTFAPSPFNHPKADVILRSSDDIDFCVFKLFLSLASPHFDAVFNSPQSPYKLLRFCYPSTVVDDPDLSDPGIFKVMAEVVDAARKYSVEVITKKVGQVLSDVKVLEKDPFRVFAIACCSQLERETRLAATYTLRQPLIPPKIPELNLITAKELLKLLQYRIHCGIAVQNLKSHPLWTTLEWKSCPVHSSGLNKKKGKKLSKKSTLNDTTKKSPEWWIQYKEEIFAALIKRPVRETVEEATRIRIACQSFPCDACRRLALDYMKKFIDEFCKEVESVTAKVELDVIRTTNESVTG